MKPSTAIIVFARAPQLGRVKTRLVPALGEQGALDLYRMMLRHAVQIAHECSPDELILACTPDAAHPELQALGKAVAATLQVQRGADIGARMHHALRTALRRHQLALLIGSDCPSLRSADLHNARDQLVVDEIAGDPGQSDSPCSNSARGTQMVFIPATDGGYVLIGTTKPCAEIFLEMPWGGVEVMKMTRQRLRDKGVKWQELKAHTDIDRAADLLALPENIRKNFMPAPKF